MSSIQERIDYVRQNGIDLSLGDVLSQSMEKWKILLGYGALATVLYFIFSFVTGAIIDFAFGINELNAEVEARMQGATDFNDLMQIYTNSMTGNSAFYYSNILKVLVTTLMYPMLVGVTYMSYKLDTTGETEMKDLFQGFQPKVYFALVLFGIVGMLLSIAGLFAFIIGIFVVLVGIFMAPAFIVINKMGTFEALKVSFQLGFKNFFPILGIAIISALLSMIGAFACGIGIVITYPFMYIAIYEVYKANMGIETMSQIEEL